jgi:hypothetical protein
LRLSRCSLRVRFDLFEIVFDARDAFLDHAAVGLDLRLAGAAEEAEAAALALKMRPGTHQSAFLVGQMRELHLQRAFARARAPAEDLQDQPGAVEHLGIPGFLEIALLHRRDRAIHHHDAGFLAFHQAGDFLDFALADISRGRDGRERDDAGTDHIEIDRARQTHGFFQPRIGRARVLRYRPLGLWRRAPQKRFEHDRASGGRAALRRAQPIRTRIPAWFQLLLRFRSS